MPDTTYHRWPPQRIICLTGLLLLCHPVLGMAAGTDSYSVDPPTNSIQTPSASIDDGGRVFSPSRLFTRRDSAEDSRNLVDRSVAADPTQTENQRLASKAQELILRASVPTPPALTGSFADFVKSTVGNPLPVFGHHLFSQNDRFGLGVDPRAVPADYRIGPGDQIIIKAWGQIDIDFQGEVDRSGAIFIPRVGSVVLNGQRAQDLQQLIQTTIAEKYRNFELTVTLGQIRQIQYYVMGMVNIAGVHTTDGTATALHGLLASGGPSMMGDLRAIELRRNGKTIAVIDTYKLIAKGEQGVDPRLLPGDVIFVPPVKGFVALAGDVKQSAIYHLKDGMTLGDVLDLSGGFNISGAQPKIRLERIVNGQRQVDLQNYTEALRRLKVEDGDIFLISPISAKIEQAVTLRGNVAEPLRKPWRAGMRVSDLIGSVDQLVRRAVWTDRNNRVSFNRLDHLVADARFKDNFTDIHWGYATVERVDPDTLQTDILTFELDKALANDPEHNLTLQDGDSVVIYSTQDFKQPSYRNLQLVKIDGEVHRPGTYVMQAGQTIKDVINQAGGITERAFLYGLFLSRERTRQQEANMITLAADKVEEDFNRHIASRATNSITQADKELDHVELEATRRLVTRLRSVPVRGRVVLNLPDPYSVRYYIDNISIEDQDHIHIPTRVNTVSVAGSVFQQTTFNWRKGARPRDYVNMAGGLKKVADQRRILVMRADGSIWQDQGWRSRYPVHAGDVIFVQEDVVVQSRQKVLGDWSQVLYQMGFGALAITTLLGW